MKTSLLTLTMVLGACAFAGCATQNGGRGGAADGRELPIQQRHHIDVVRSLAADLRPGMTRAEVYTLLGAPAEYRGDTWVYRASGSNAGSDDGETFRVKFDGDRYVEHSAG